MCDVVGISVRDINIELFCRMKIPNRFYEPVRNLFLSSIEMLHEESGPSFFFLCSHWMKFG